MPSKYSIGFCGTSLSWYWYYQERLINQLQKNTGRFVRGMNYGFNGSTSDGGVLRIDQTVHDHPDFVTLEYSMNDAAFVTRTNAVNNHITMLNALKAVMPANRIWLMTMNPTTDPSRSNLPDYYQDYRDLAVSQGVGLIDLQPIYTAAGYGGDVHPTRSQQETIAAPALLSVFQPLIT